jgi:N-acetylneuraminate synthase
VSTPWDEPSIELLATLDALTLKIVSAGLFNPYLIKISCRTWQHLLDWRATGVDLGDAGVCGEQD